MTKLRILVSPGLTISLIDECLQIVNRTGVVKLSKVETDAFFAALDEMEESEEFAEAMGEVVSPYSEENPDNAFNTDYST